jgi:acid stress-induced BolA-like protein IbaG/YrbA
VISIIRHQQKSYNAAFISRLRAKITGNFRMSISNEAVEALILKGIEDASVTVTGDGYKYETTVISNAFANLSKVKRHQLVYSSVNEAITSGELHALTITALTPEEAA